MEFFEGYVSACEYKSYKTHTTAVVSVIKNPAQSIDSSRVWKWMRNVSGHALLRWRDHSY